MNLFEFTLLDIIFIFFPLLLYLFYIAYSNNIDKKVNNLLLEITLFSSLYLVIRYGKSIDENIPILIINVPLIIAYIKNRPIAIVSISICLIIYYYYYFGYSWMLLIIEYLIYYCIFLIKERKKYSMQIFIYLFLILKAIFFGYFVSYHYDQSLLSIEAFMKISCIIFLLITVTYLSLLLFEKGEEIIKLHMTIKELEKEKQIRMSLFQITHEIKNPIAVCKGYLDMFDTSNIEHSKKYIPIIREEINRTLILLQDFLYVQKIKIEKDILDMNLLMEEIIMSLKPLFKEKEIEVSSNIIDDEIYMNGDYNRLKQVFINLIKNSIEAMTNDRKHKLRLEVNDLKSKVEVKVIDNGVGITEENLKKMTHPFFTTKQSGTGLGVYLSNEIVKAHDGKIHYESNKKGTTVTLLFPKNMKN